MLGELTAIETLCHMIVSNKVEDCIITFPSPFNESSVIDLYVNLDKKTKNTVKLVNGTPYISTKVRLKARILSSEKDVNYFSDGNLAIIEEYANSYINSKIKDYLYKTSKEFGSDIDLFGKHAVKYFKTWDDWLDYNWLDNYKNAFFDVDANIKITSSYLIS